MLTGIINTFTKPSIPDPMKICLGVLITADGQTRHGDDVNAHFLQLLFMQFPKNPVKVPF
jgi:hypothetical protein